MAGNGSSKLLVRGGSIPAGLGVSRGYVDIVREACACRGLEVINRSRAGETSFDGVETFHQDIAAELPDILAIHFGLDDLFAAVYRSEFKENLVRMVRLARSCPIPRICLITSQPFENACDRDSADMFYRAIREVCSDMGCALVPVHTFWTGYITEKGIALPSLIQDDTRLPNEKGHELFAMALLNSIRIM